MKTMRKLIAALFVAALMSVSAHAADPSGIWTWTFAAPGGGQGGKGGGATQSLTLTLENDKLTGKMAGSRGQSVAISEASFKDDTVRFTVARPGRDGNQIVTKYVGKLSGDTLTGSVEAAGRGDRVMKRDWVASRSK